MWRKGERQRPAGQCHEDVLAFKRDGGVSSGGCYLRLLSIPVSLVLFGGGDPRFALRPTGPGSAFCMLEWPPRALRTAMPRDRGGRRTSD